MVATYMKREIEPIGYIAMRIASDEAYWQDYIDMNNFVWNIKFCAFKFFIYKEERL